MGQFHHLNVITLHGVVTKCKHVMHNIHQLLWVFICDFIIIKFMGLGPKDCAEGNAYSKVYVLYSTKI